VVGYHLYFFTCSLLQALGVSEGLGVFARNLVSGAKKAEGEVSRKDAKVLKDGGWSTPESSAS